jgi:putative FmdB family regulatory protein
MPTYEYGCGECGHEWEEIQRITEPPSEVCPKCSKSAAHRLISAGTNFILKGGGWYSDLYSSPKTATKKADANGGSTSDAGGKIDKADTATSATGAAPAPAPTPSSTPPTTPPAASSA